MSEDTEPIDVDALVADLKRRVERKKAQGLYSVDELAADALDGTEPVHADDLERLRPMAAVRVDVGVAGSDKPVVGRAINPLKRRLVKGVSQPLYGIADQAGRFNASLLAYVAQLGRELALQKERAADADTRAANADRRAETLARELGTTRESLSELSRRLQILEASMGTSGSALRQDDTPPGTPSRPVNDGALGLVLEASRTREGSDLAWTGLRSSAEAPVLHVGSGSGRELGSLGEGAFGVDSDPELVAAARRERRAVTAADPREYVAGLTPRSLGGAVVTTLTERLDGRELLSLLSGLRVALRQGAPLVVAASTPVTVDEEYEAWDDPFLVRPFPPNALRAVAEAAGLGDLEIDEAPAGSAGESRYCLRAKS